jgi:hypothetical protein
MIDNDFNKIKEIKHYGLIKKYCKNVEEIIKEIKGNRIAKKYLECLSFCHSLIHMENTYLGDPLEVEMVSNTPFNCQYTWNKSDSQISKIFFPKSIYEEI